MAKNAQQFEQRPWGTFEVLHEFKSANGKEDFVIKKIIVFPGKRLSYQSHGKRKEYWFVAEGQGLVTLDDTDQTVGTGSRVEVAVQTKHRITNTDSQNNLVFIEITAGEFDEHDIVRYEDDFGRSTKV
jgi:mannose-6-phosphate isomerase-like protein (cupin superfamily)